MKVARISLVVLALGTLVGGAAVKADWSWPWSNKGASAAKGNMKAQPKLKPKSSPSALSKMGNNTKKMFGGMFKKKPSMKKKTAFDTPNVPPSAAGAKSQSKLSSWFAPKEPPPLKTTDDWMKLKQIRPWE
jgi:hypothetical protein